MKKLLLAAAAAAGYLFGTENGRRKLEQFKNDPRVREKVQQATDTFNEKAPDSVKEKVDVIKDKVNKGESAEHASDDFITPTPPAPSTDDAPPAESGPTSTPTDPGPAPTDPGATTSR